MGDGYNRTRFAATRDPVENAPPEPDYIEGLSMRMTQAMNYYQKQERFAGESPQAKIPVLIHSTIWQKSSQGGWVQAWWTSSAGNSGTKVTPEFLQERGYPVLPLSGLVNYPLHLVGLGGQRTCPLGFLIARLQVREVAGYDEDVVFLVVPDGYSSDRTRFAATRS